MSRGLARAAFLVATLLSSTVAAAQDGMREGLRDGESVRETDAAFPNAGPVDEDGEPTIWAVRIFDELTGRAIPDAKVKVPYHSVGAVTPAEIRYQAVGSADEDGWVRIPVADLEGWRDYIVADAPGYAANEYCAHDDSECALVPGVDVPVVVLDYHGHPVPHAEVALNLGCGHIPDQRTARTDEHGRAVLPSILPSRHRDIWLLAPGVHRGTTQLTGTWRPGDPPVVIHAPPGIVVSGRVLRADGSTVVGAVVAPKGNQRPACATGPDGRFRLVGVTRWAEIAVEYQEDEEWQETSFVAPPEGVERTLTLGAATAGLPLDVRVASPEREPIPRVRVVAVRRADGRTLTARADASGRVEFVVPAGRWEVFTDGELGTWGTARATVEVSTGERASTTLVPARNPTVRVDASRVLGAEVMTATLGQFHKWDPQKIDGQDVPISGDEPTRFLVHSTEGGSRILRFFDAPVGGTAEGETLVLDWPASTQVTVRCFDADGSAVPARLRVVRDRNNVDLGFHGEDDEDAVAAVATYETWLDGTVDWIVDTPGDVFVPATGTLRIDAAGGTVDLGDVRLRKATGSALHVDLPPGLTDRGGSVTVRTLGGSYVEWAELHEDGSTDLLLPFYGASLTQILVEVDESDVLSFRFRPEGPPPWRVKWPTGSLRFRVVGPGGEPLFRFTLIVDGRVFDGEIDDDGWTQVRGFTAGPHEVVVAGAGQLAKVYRLQMRAGEARQFTVVLRPR